MAKVKYFNKDAQKWEYAETGGTPKRGVHYWLQQDQQPIYDYVNRKVVDVTGQCRLSITLGSNQLDKSMLEGLAMSVTLPSGNVVTKYSGNTTGFTTGSVTVVFPEVAGYKKPDNYILSYKKGFVSKKFNYLGEVVTVNPMVEGVAADSTYTYTVTAENAVALTEGASLGAVISGVTQWLVPHGVTMTVTPTSVDGYKSSVVEYIPSTVEGDINMKWNENKLGLFICDSSGNLFDKEDTSVLDAIGVVLITDTLSIIIAKDEWYSEEPMTAWNGNTYSAWGGYNTTVSGCTTTTSESTAITDMNGSANTDAIIAALSGTSDDYSYGYTGAPAAEYCRAYSPGYKDGQWYLPSAGEMNAIVMNQTDIDTALSSIGGESLSNNNATWTSTQYSATRAWWYYWHDQSSEYFGKNEYCEVRPVCIY